MFTFLQSFCTSVEYSQHHLCRDIMCFFYVYCLFPSYKHKCIKLLYDHLAYFYGKLDFHFIYFRFSISHLKILKNSRRFSPRFRCQFILYKKWYNFTKWKRGFSIFKKYACKFSINFLHSEIYNLKGLVFLPLIMQSIFHLKI